MVMIRPPICRFYQAGSCFKAEFCPFYHPVDICKNFSVSGWCPYRKKCYFRHDLSVFREPPNEQSSAVCGFFLNGQCIYGDFCSFSHQVTAPEGLAALSLYEYKELQAKKKADRDKRLLKPRVLPYSSTMNASQPKSVFPEKEEGRGDEEKASISESNFVSKSVHTITQRPQLKYEQADSRTAQPCDIRKMRDFEINRFLKRFPSDQIKETSHLNSLRTFNLVFSSTDPDWTYSVREITLDFGFPPDYPLVPFTVRVVATPELPDLLVEHLNSELTAHVQALFDSYTNDNIICILLRPFLMWLDRNLEDLFTQGLRKVKAKLIEEGTYIPTKVDDHSGSHSKNSFNSSDDKNSDSESDHSATESESQVSDKILTNPLISQNDIIHSSDNSNWYTWRQKLSFEGLNLRGQAGACILSKFQVSCHCTGCRAYFPWTFALRKTLPDDPSNWCLSSCPPYTATCQVCRLKFGLLFSAELAHNFSDAMGHISTENCIVIDVRLETLEVVLLCSECNSHLRFSNIKSDKLTTKHCLKCNLLYGIIYSTIKLALPVKASGEVYSGFKSAVVRHAFEHIPASVQSKLKNQYSFQGHIPQYGKPLPFNGTCKHYRKSHRWFRFQCCDRLFPCEVCHDEAVGEVHEVNMAQRIVCGFCSKEQVYTPTRPCVACSKDLTTRHSAHWEGGKGCRNTVVMSRKDNKKYTTTNKTSKSKSKN